MIAESKCPATNGGIDVSCQVYNYILVGRVIVLFRTHFRSTFGLGLSLSLCPDIMSSSPVASMACLSVPVLEIRSQSGRRVFIHQMPHISVFTVLRSDLIHNITSHSTTPPAPYLGISKCISAINRTEFASTANRWLYRRVNDNSHRVLCSYTPHNISDPVDCIRWEESGNRIQHYRLLRHAK